MKVISGILRGRNIKGYNIDGTRPTMDRVKESLFASINEYIKNSVVLDLFAGSGNLGIEAISNGSDKCYFVDNNRECIKVINDNVNNFGISNKSVVLNRDYRIALKYFRDNNIKFDLILVDPPYKYQVINEILYLVSEYNLLNNGGIIVLEYSFDKIDNIQDHDVLILAGSIPPSLPNDIYQSIMHRLSHKDIRIIVDATNQLLLKVLPYKPFLIKPNHRELEEIFNTSINSQEELIKYATKLQEMGAINVLVSLGKNGALLVSENHHVYTCEAAKGKLINSVGSGDSMVAGFLAGYMKTNDYKEAIRLGSACGGATAFSADLAQREGIEEVLQQLKPKIIR